MKRIYCLITVGILLSATSCYVLQVIILPQSRPLESASYPISGERKQARSRTVNSPDQATIPDGLSGMEVNAKNRQAPDTHVFRPQTFTEAASGQSKAGPKKSRRDSVSLNSTRPNRGKLTGKTTR
jgi:hypothetical protein